MDRSAAAVALIALSLLLAGCGSPPIDPNAITGDACPPPCWYGLTPGESTKDDALAVLDSLDFVTDVKVESLGFVGGGSAIVWTHVSGAPFTIYANPDGRVVGIDVPFDQPLTLGQFVDAFGEPDGLQVSPISVESYLSILWLARGIQVSMPARTRGYNILIRRNVEFDNLQYFVPTETYFDYVKLWVSDDRAVGSSFYAWQGFGTYRLSH